MTESGVPAQLDSKILTGFRSPCMGNNFSKPCGFHQFYLETDVVVPEPPSRTSPLDLRLIFNKLYSFLCGLLLCETWRFLYLSPDLQRYEHVELDFSLSCPGSTDDPCAHWDHTVQLYVCCNSASKLCGLELGRWITPFRRWISSASHPIDI